VGGAAAEANECFGEATGSGDCVVGMADEDATAVGGEGYISYILDLNDFGVEGGGGCEGDF
jgi:hypothetical protein